MHEKLSFPSPVGDLTVSAKNGHVVGLDWGANSLTQSDSPVLNLAKAQLQSYFDGALTTFDLRMSFGATEFQKRFLQALIDIPFGEIKTYGELAGELGVSAQAIGQACGANTIPIIIPCHRVLASDGLGGFSGRGGVETKVWLLKHEKAGGLLI